MTAPTPAPPHSAAPPWHRPIPDPQHHNPGGRLPRGWFTDTDAERAHTAGRTIRPEPFSVDGRLYLAVRTPAHIIAVMTERDAYRFADAMIDDLEMTRRAWIDR